LDPLAQDFLLMLVIVAAAARDQESLERTRLGVERREAGQGEGGKEEGFGHDWNSEEGLLQPLQALRRGKTSRRKGAEVSH